MQNQLQWQVYCKSYGTKHLLHFAQHIAKLLFIHRHMKGTRGLSAASITIVILLQFIKAFKKVSF